MTIEITNEFYTVEYLRRHPDKIFVFGDNLERKGKGGQAIIRGEPNVFGIVTKRFPSMTEDAFFCDRLDEIVAIESDLTKLFSLSLVRDIVFPSSGIGTGLSKLKEKSPHIWKHLNERLMFYFQYQNPN